MNDLLKYSLYEMIRSRWIFIYTGFYLATVVALYSLSDDMTQVLISLSNIVLGITPLIGILFGTTYYYSLRDFVQVFLSQPYSRWYVIRSLYSGLAIALCLSIVVGMGIPMLILGAWGADYIRVFGLVLFSAIALSVIFSLLSFYISMRYDDRVKGLSISILTWFFFAVIYDGLVLLLLMLLRDYPLDNLALFLMILNPIDLCRVLISMNLDVSAMMGYTGAVLSRFLGSGLGTVLTIVSIGMWMMLPYVGLKRLTKRKDF